MANAAFKTSFEFGLGPNSTRISESELKTSFKGSISHHQKSISIRARRRGFLLGPTKKNLEKSRLCTKKLSPNPKKAKKVAVGQKSGVFLKMIRDDLKNYFLTQAVKVDCHSIVCWWEGLKHRSSSSNGRNQSPTKKKLPYGTLTLATLSTRHCRHSLRLNPHLPSFAVLHFENC